MEVVPVMSIVAAVTLPIATLLALMVLQYRLTARITRLYYADIPPEEVSGGDELSGRKGRRLVVILAIIASLVAGAIVYSSWMYLIPTGSMPIPSVPIVDYFVCSAFAHLAILIPTFLALYRVQKNEG